MNIVKSLTWVLLVIIILSLNQNTTSDNAQVELTIEVLPELEAGNLTLTKEYDFPHIAFVKPVFTSTAYGSFYQYYNCFYSGECYVNDASGYFEKETVDTWSTSNGALNLINGLRDRGIPEDKISIISDVDVHNNDLYFENGTLKYQNMIFFHNEYVTMSEYRNTINFIKNGGNVMMMNGNAFFGEVDYNPVTDKVSMVDAHGFAYDGENGTFSKAYYRFLNNKNGQENVKWMGSEYCTFRKGATNGATFNVSNTNPHPIAQTMIDQGISAIATNYASIEENCVVTPNVHIIADWDTEFEQPHRGIKIYEYFPSGPIGGSLIHFGFFGTNQFRETSMVIDTVHEVAFHQIGHINQPWIKYPNDGSVLKDEKTIIDFTSNWEYEVYINGTISDIKPKERLILSEGVYNLTIVFQTVDGPIIRSVMFEIDRTSPTAIINYSIEEGKLTEFIAEVNDQNPEYISIDFHPELVTKRRYMVNGSNGGPHLHYNMSVTSVINDFKDNIFILRIETIDSAGNTGLNWFNIDVNGVESQVSELKIIQPEFQKINSTTGYVDIPELPSTFTAKLDISNDYGENWERSNFNAIDNATLRSFVNKNSDSIWYRVVLFQNNAFELYYPEIRSYYWDDTIISTKELKFSYENNNFNSSVAIHYEQFTQANISMYISNVTTTYQLDIFNSTLLDITEEKYFFTKELNLTDGKYKLELIIETSKYKFSRIYHIMIGSSFGQSITENKSVGLNYRLEKNEIPKEIEFLRIITSQSKIDIHFNNLIGVLFYGDQVNATIYGYTLNMTLLYTLNLSFSFKNSSFNFQVETRGNYTNRFQEIFTILYYVETTREWSLEISQNEETIAQVSETYNSLVSIEIYSLGNYTLELNFKSLNSLYSYNIEMINYTPPPHDPWEPPTSSPSENIPNSSTTSIDQYTISQSERQDAIFSVFSVIGFFMIVLLLRKSHFIPFYKKRL